MLIFGTKQAQVVEGGFPLALLLGGAPALFPRPVHCLQGAGDHRAGTAGARARQGASRRDVTLRNDG